MPTNAYHQYCNIPYMGGSNVGYPIKQFNNNSLDASNKTMTNLRPTSMPQHNNAILTGLHPNPPQFQNCDNSSSFSTMRSQYKNTTNDKKKNLTPMSSSLLLSQRKSGAVGTSSIIKEGALSYKSYDTNTTKSILRRLRSASCVPPKKKGM